MAGVDDCFIGEFEHLALQRTHNRFERSAPQVRPANASCKQSVPGKEPAWLAFSRFRGGRSGATVRYVRGHVETHTALRMARSVQHLRFEASPADRVAFAQQFADFDLFRRLAANPRGLYVDHAIKLQIVGMHSNGSAGGFPDAPESSHVIDMRVRDNDCGYTQLVATDDVEDPLGVVPGINNQSLVRFWIADNMAIALQHSNRENFVDEFGCS